MSEYQYYEFLAIDRPHSDNTPAHGKIPATYLGAVNGGKKVQPAVRRSGSSLSGQI